MIARIAFFLILLIAAAEAQQFGPAQFPIKDDDGDPMSNYGVDAEQMAQVARLPGLIDVGGSKSDVTLYQFYDLNCPFCREAAADVDRLIRSEPALRLVFVPYPVLSVQSVEGDGSSLPCASSARRSSSWNSTARSTPAAASSTATARLPWHRR